MAKVERSALLPYSCDQMYQIINDVASYSLFLKGCRSSKVISESPAEMVAMLELAKGAISQRFVTRNTLIPGKQIEMHLEEGPFRALRGRWLFTALDDKHCKVSFNLHFEMKHPLIGLAFGSLLTQVANSMVDTFCQRAREVYGS